MKKIAIFLSGTGSNAKNICTYFKEHQSIEIALLLSNKTNSGTYAIANEFQIPYTIFNKTDFYETENVLEILIGHKINTIVLAGFLWLMPNNILKKYHNQIINIHPALLPKYGGKGMYGHHVHEAVYKNKEVESGITIHLCNEEYDKGKLLFQTSVHLNITDTPQTIAQKVLALEHQYFPKIIEQYILEQK